MIYRVDGNDFEDIDDVIGYCIEDDYHKDDDSDFEDWVNDCYSGADINGDYYRPYDILEALDSFALNCLKDDYCSEKNSEDEDNAREELRCAESGEKIYIQNYIVEVLDDEDTTEEEEDVGTICQRLKMEHERLKNETSAESKQTEEIMKLIQVVE